ncbi:MAG: hypothetical protein WC692_07545 [Erythrobacter sp.]|jgi:hypothetical protein
MSLGKLFKVEVTPTPAMLAELEEFVFFAQRPAAPDPKVTGYYDQRGKLRRVVARYPDGWRAQINIDRNGYITSSRASISLKVKCGEADA